MSEEDQLIGANQLKSHLSIGHTYGDWGSFPGGSDSEDPACNAGGPGSIPESERSPGDGNGNAFQYSCLENPMHRGAWRATVHEVAKRHESDWHFHTLHGGWNIILHYLHTMKFPTPTLIWFCWAKRKRFCSQVSLWRTAECKIVEGVEKVSLRLKMILYDKELFLIMKRSTARLYIVTLLI